MRIRLAVAIAALFSLFAAVPASAATAGPPPGSQWQWILDHPITASEATLNVPVFDVDGVDTPASRVASMNAAGKYTICYFSAGSFENWRPDASKFPAAVKGKNLDGWAGEKWLDIRNINALGPIMKARMQACKDKGFDAVEPDNVDGYQNSSGFPLTAAHQITYNTWLADTAHSLGLAIALKNDIDQVKQLEPKFDFAVNEECLAYSECGVYSAFTSKGKAVLHVEYTGTQTKICSKKPVGFSTMKKRLDLDAWRQPCA